MCFNAKPKVDTSYQDFQKEEAVRARVKEDHRQERVAEGMLNIKNVFDGKPQAPVKPQPDIPADPAKTIAGGEASVATAFGGLSDVLKQRRKAQEGYYLPQLDDQYDSAQDELLFALSRAGLVNSTAAGKKQVDLSKTFALNRGKILADIDSDVAGTRTRMNQNRASIEAALRSSGDSSAANNAAMASAATFRQEQPNLDPLGNVFHGLSSGIGAARQGYDVGSIKRMATPKSLTTNYSRKVGS